MINSITSNIIVRPVAATDNPALKQFVESVPDGGRVAFQPRYKVDDIERASSLLRPGNRGFAAFLEGKPLGIIYAWAHRVIYGNKEYPAVLLNGLSVHPDYRRQGLATRLLREALNWANESFGEGKLLVYGYIQSGNQGSEAACIGVGGQLSGRYLTVSPTRTLPDSNPTSPNLIREATESELEGIATNLANFYGGYDFLQPQTTATLAEWLTPKEIEGRTVKLASYYIAQNSAGELLAGMGVFNGLVLFDLQIVKTSGLVKLLNCVLKIIPADGFLSPLPVSRVWYRDLIAARALWQSIRKLESSRGRTLTTSFDPNSPLKPLFQSGLAPTSKLQLIIFTKPEGATTTGKFLAGYES